MTFRKSSIKPRMTDLKHSFRIGAFLPALFSVFILFLINNYGMLKYYVQQPEEQRSPVYRYFFFDLSYSYGMLVILLFAFGVLMGISAFNFVNSKKMSNVFLSFNIKRRDLFLNRCASSIAYLFLAVLAPMVLVLLVNVHFLGFESVFLAPWFYLVIALFTYALIGFAAAVLAAISAGSVFEAAIYSMIFIFSPSMLLTGADLLLGAFLRGYPVATRSLSLAAYSPQMLTSQLGMENKLGFLNPFTFLNTSSSATMSNTSGNYAAMFGFLEKGNTVSVGFEHYWPIFLWFGICALLLFTAEKALNARKAENAGSFGKNRAVRGFSVTILSVFAFCFIAARFSSQRVLAIALSVVAFFAVYFILEFAILRSLRDVKSGLLKLPIVLGVLLCVLAIPFTGAFGYSKRLPDAGEVEKVYLSNLSQNNLFFEGSEYGTLSGPYTAEKDIAMLLELHKTLIEETSVLDGNVLIEDSSIRQTGCYVQYQMKNGKTMNRYFPIEGEALQQAVVKLADSEYTKNLLQTYFLLPGAGLDALVQEYYEDGKNGMYSLSLEEYNKLSRINAFAQYYTSTKLNELYLLAKDGSQTGGPLSAYLSEQDFDALKQCIYNDYLRLGAQKILLPEDKVLGGIAFGAYSFAEQQIMDKSHGDYASYTLDFVYSGRMIQVTESMSETVAFLSGKDLLKFFESDATIVGVGIRKLSSDADVLRYVNSPWFVEKDASAFAPVIYDISSYGEDWKTYLSGLQMEVKTDSAEVQRLFNSAYMTCYPDAKDYVAQFVFSDNRSIVLYIPADKMP